MFTIQDVVGRALWNLTLFSKAISKFLIENLLLWLSYWLVLLHHNLLQWCVHLSIFYLQWKFTFKLSQPVFEGVYFWTRGSILFIIISRKQSQTVVTLRTLISWPSADRLWEFWERGRISRAFSVDFALRWRARRAVFLSLFLLCFCVVHTENCRSKEKMWLPSFFPSSLTHGAPLSLTQLLKVSFPRKQA